MPTDIGTTGGTTPYVYRVVVEPDVDRFYAEIPTLPGCHSWGFTCEEALKSIKEALELWLEVKKESGEPIPFDVIAIQQDLEDLLGRKVHVLTEPAISPYMKDQVLREAVAL